MTKSGKRYNNEYCYVIRMADGRPWGSPERGARRRLRRLSVERIELGSPPRRQDGPDPPEKTVQTRSGKVVMRGMQAGILAVKALEG